jgi:hypothetical protein
VARLLFLVPAITKNLSAQTNFMLFNMIFCSFTGIIPWLQNHLLACPFKKLTGIDCPGCGFQRSVIELLQGNLNQSLHYYPATIPLLITASLFIIDKQLIFANKEWVKKGVVMFTAFVIAGSYILKISGHQL